MSAKTVAGERRDRWEILRNRPLLTLMSGHFTVDMYVGLLPVLYPLLTDRFSLDLATVGFVATAYSGMASLSQPFFGWIADRYGTRFIGLALIWTATVFATIGFAPSFPILLVLAAAAGLGSGAYHPFGALNAHAVIPPRQRNTAMSIYVTGGTLGVALGPLVGVILFELFGVHGTAVMIAPGLGTACWLLFEMRKIAVPRAVQTETRQVYPPVPLVPMLAVIAVMMSRSWTIISIEAFIPTWYKDLGYSAAFYGALSTTIVLASAFGNVGVGSLADRFGRRSLILWSLVLTVPAILLFAQFTGPVAFLTTTAVGFLASSTGPVMLVMAQQLMAGRKGLASGLILGIGFVTGAIGVPVMGAVADAFGMQTAMRSQVIVIVVTLLAAWFIPSEGFLREHGQRSDAAAAGAGPIEAAGQGEEPRIATR